MPFFAKSVVKVVLIKEIHADHIPRIPTPVPDAQSGTAGLRLLIAPAQRVIRGGQRGSLGRVDGKQLVQAEPTDKLGAVRRQLAQREWPTFRACEKNASMKYSGRPVGFRCSNPPSGFRRI